MRRLDSGVLKHNLVHAERVQALVHVCNGILRLVRGRPSCIEYARDFRGMSGTDKRPNRKRKRSAQERG
jgi:hypothetical protein